MNLGTDGESRVRGYLFVLERSMRSFLSRETVADAVREVESHLRERVASAEPLPNERDALERILNELGPPLHVARAYSDELTVDEAVVTGRFFAVTRAILRVASTGITSFLVGIGLFVGYCTALALAVIAVLKPIFPANVGVWAYKGLPLTIGAQFPAPGGAPPMGGYWIIPVALALSVMILIVTHRAARHWLRHWRGRFSVVSPS